MIVINNDKAIDIAKSKIRLWRDKQFVKNDIAIQNALVDGTSILELVAIRDYLRDLPSSCDNKNIDELTCILKSLGE